MEENWFHYDRQTAQITVRLRGGRELKIIPEQIMVSYFSGGPGGQNVNKNQNGVRLTYNIPSECLNTFQKTRQLVTRSISQRSREQNMRQAYDQLAEKIKWYFYVPPKRTKTRIPRGSKENRLQNKKMRGNLKHDRKKIDY